VGIPDSINPNYPVKRIKTIPDTSKVVFKFFMEYRTLKTEAEVIELVQNSLNNVETEKSFEDNYEVMLKLFCAIKRLKSIRPKGTFRAVGVSFKQTSTPQK